MDAGAIDSIEDVYNNIPFIYGNNFFILSRNILDFWIFYWLSQASKQNNIEIVDILLKKKANIDIQDDHGNTGLIWGIILIKLVRILSNL